MPSALFSNTPQASPQDGLEQARQALINKPSALPQESSMSAPPVDNQTQWEHTNALKASASGFDYFGAMSREDGFIARGIGHLVGHEHFNPDPAWRPYAGNNWKELSQGITEDLLPEFQKAVQESTSSAHADYLKGMVLEKQHDEELLSTMGGLGNTARFAYGMVSPESVALGLATMGASKVAGTIRGGMTLANAGKMARDASRVVDPAERTAQLAKAAAAMEEAGRAASNPRGGVGCAL